MSELISEFFYISETKISIMPYLIDERKNDYKSYKNRDYSICIIGRLAASKGHKELLYAFKDCEEKFPMLNLVIVGDGPEKNNLIKISQELNLYDKIKFHDHIPNKEIYNIFSNALVSISASKSEAFGIVNIESLREGTPIICTKTEGTKDILEHGKNGFFVELTKKYDLCIQLENILSDWKYYSLNALDTFDKNYSKNNISNHFQKLNKIINH